MDDASVATATVTKAVIASTMTIVKCHASNHQQRQYNVGINVQVNTYSTVDIIVICMVNLNTFGVIPKQFRRNSCHARYVSFPVAVYFIHKICLARVLLALAWCKRAALPV